MGRRVLCAGLVHVMYLDVRWTLGSGEGVHLVLQAAAAVVVVVARIPAVMDQMQHMIHLLTTKSEYYTA